MHQRVPPSDVLDPEDHGPERPPGWTEHTIAEVATGRLRITPRPSDGALNLFWTPRPADKSMTGIGLHEIMNTMRGFRAVLSHRPAAGIDYPLMRDPKHGFFVCVLAPGNYEVRYGLYLDWYEPTPEALGVTALEPEVARRIAYFAAFGPRHKPVKPEIAVKPSASRPRIRR